MPKIKIANLHSSKDDRVQAELLDVVSDSVARAIKARGNAGEDSKTLGRIGLIPPITLGIVYRPDIPTGKPLA